MEKILSEDYCSFEISKLLKEKGFDIFCDRGWESIDYDKDHDVNCYPYNKPYPFNEEKRSILSVSRWMSAPTHQMAMKWLREVHKISIEIYCIPSYTEGLVVWRYMIRNCETCDEVDYPNGYPAQECLTFEEAVEAALKYTLENFI